MVSGCSPLCSHLTGVNLTNVYLRSANLTNVYLRSANLTNANLRSANLKNAEGMTFTPPHHNYTQTITALIKCN